MKIRYTFLLFFLWIIPCSAQFASEGYAGSVRIIPVRFAEQGDSLVVEFDVSVHREALSARQSWTIAPRLATVDSLFELPYLLINGRQKARLYYRKTVFENVALRASPPYRLTAVPQQADTVIRYSFCCPYALWMDTATLEIKQELMSPAGKKQLFVTGGFGRVELEPRTPYQVAPRVNYVLPEREDKQRRMQGQAFLDFQVGRSVILPEYRRNPEELGKIAEAVSKVRNDPDVNITGLYIEGYASPDGSYALNERLSRERAEALRDYMIRSFGLDLALFRVLSVPEDWDGLRVLVDESTLPQKDRIYAILDSNDAPDRKEQRLKALGAPWRTMLNELFPSLRRVEYQIDFSVKDFSVEESRYLASRNPERLSHRELFLLADTYEKGTPEREAVFETIVRLYPDDPTALLNTAALMLERDEDVSAKRILDRLGDDPRTANNLGVYWLRAGDLDTARQYFQQARDAGIPEAEHNAAEVELKHQDNLLMERYNR